MSIRPLYLAGIISSMAELIAAYSPPMPLPASTRVAYKKITQPPPTWVAALRPLPIRYTPRVTMNRFLRPSLSDSRPNTSAPMTSPMRYQVAMSAARPADRPRVFLSVRVALRLAAMVISRPSRTQATPRATTIFVWNLDQGSRSIRAGMTLRIVGPSARPDADAIVHLRLKQCSGRSYPDDRKPHGVRPAFASFLRAANPLSRLTI